MRTLVFSAKSTVRLLDIKPLTTGLATTFEVLTASRNDATNLALLAALESSAPTVYDGTLQSLIARRNKAGHLAVLQRWHKLTALQREFLQEGRGRMSGAIRDAVLTDDDQLFANACELVEQFNEFDLVPTLVTLAENQKSKHAQLATELVLRLVDRLSEILHGPRDYQDRRDPESLRRLVLKSLESSVERFRTHNRPELIEAFVILGGPSSGVLRAILDDPHHPCYLIVISTLANSQSTGVIQFLLKSLQSEFASLNILNVISKRSDPQFVSQLLDYSSQEMSAKAVKNLGRIRSFSWLKHGQDGYTGFDEQDQARCIKLVSMSGVKPDDFMDLLEDILKHGPPAGRLAACDALASLPGDRGNHLVLDAVNDADPQVQAVATGQLRDRHVPGAMAILLKQIDSDHEAVRQATRESLSEFSFANFLTGFEGLQDSARRSTGALVQKVDLKTVASLTIEIEAQSRKRRMRAIEMADVMRLVPQVVEPILLLLEDTDHLVRAAAADALQFCHTGEVREALQQATADRSAAVQNAAKASLAVLAKTPVMAPMESL